MKKILICTYALIIVISSCRVVDKVPYTENVVPPTLASLNEHMVLATLYHQQSAEYAAACLQSYNLCKIIIDDELLKQTSSKSLAVVLDIDETVLDNSPYQAECVLENISYPTKWDEWCNLAIAKPVPGALEFLKYAESKGVIAFYITNRSEHLKTSTVKNLKDQGFPFADSVHVIMRTKESSKEGRRQVIQELYNIVILIGDNLSDLSDAFDDRTNHERVIEANKMQKDFGSKLVILPNAMYGDWENAILKADKQKSTSKTKLRHHALSGF